MDIEQIMENFIFYGIGVWVGFKILEIYLQSKLSQAEGELAQQVQLVKERLHVVASEKHYDTLYWFDQNSGQFLAQGKDQQEVINVLKIRFPTHIFVLPDLKMLHAPHWIPQEMEDLDNKV